MVLIDMFRFLDGLRLKIATTHIKLHLLHEIIVMICFAIMVIIQNFIHTEQRPKSNFSFCSFSPLQICSPVYCLVCACVCVYLYIANQYVEKLCKAFVLLLQMSRRRKMRRQSRYAIYTVIMRTKEMCDYIQED